MSPAHGCRGYATTLAFLSPTMPVPRDKNKPKPNTIVQTNSLPLLPAGGGWSVKPKCVIQAQARRWKPSFPLSQRAVQARLACPPGSFLSGKHWQLWTRFTGRARAWPHNRVCVRENIQIKSKKAVWPWNCKTRNYHQLHKTGCNRMSYAWGILHYRILYTMPVQNMFKKGFVDSVQTDAK